MEYVAIDFQTANRWHKSACSVALVTVKDALLRERTKNYKFNVPE